MVERFSLQPLDGLDGDNFSLAHAKEPQRGLAQETLFSKEYRAAQAIIEDGIAKSVAGGYKELKVEFTGDGETDPTGKNMRRMTLAQFFGGNSLHKMVNSDDHAALFALYGEKIEAHASRQGHKFGSVAMRTNPPTVRSGGREYDDFKKAAAGDPIENDD